MTAKEWTRRKRPFRVTITDADGDVFFERIAKDVKLELPRSHPGVMTSEDVEKWWADPYGGPGNQYQGWIGVWIKTATDEEEKNENGDDG